MIARVSRCEVGFIFGATMADSAKPELQFDKLEEGNQADTWVPWYTMHKLMNGLVEVAKLVGGETGSSALDIAEKLGEWMYERTSRWDEETRKRVLSVEYGGLNGCMKRNWNTGICCCIIKTQSVRNLRKNLPK